MLFELIDAGTIPKQVDWQPTAVLDRMYKTLILNNNSELPHLPLSSLMPCFTTSPELYILFGMGASHVPGIGRPTSPPAEGH